MHRLLLLLLLLTCPARLRAQAPDTSAFGSLVAAERAFSATSDLEGSRSAFLRFLAPDGLLLRPHPVSAHAFWRDRPSPPVALTWGPETAAVDASGTWGFTTGPYEVRRAGAAPGCGTYVTVWTREAGEPWLAALDGGGPGACRPLPGTVARLAPATPGGTAATLAATDAQATPPATPDVRVVGAPLAPEAPRVRTRLDVAPRGDWGLTLGTTAGATPATWYRLWRHDADGWHVVLAATVPER